MTYITNFNLVALVILSLNLILNIILATVMHRGKQDKQAAIIIWPFILLEVLAIALWFYQWT